MGTNVKAATADISGKGGAGRGLCHRLRQADAALLLVNRWLMILILGAMALMVFTSVMLRYLSSGALVWAEELSRYAMIWLGFLGMGPVLRAGGHVAVDSLVERLPPAPARLVRLAVLLSVAGTCIWVAIAGWAYVGRSWHQTTPVLGLPFALVALAAPVGFMLTLWHLAMVATGFVRDGVFEASDDLAPEKASAS